jgi:tetratricopeptide (TPR) repeat protein
VRRTIAALTVLATGAGAAGVAYQVAARQRDYRAFVVRGDAALRDDQTFAAIEAYSGAIALRSESMLAYLRRGETYRKRADRGDLEAAARDFRVASQLDPAATRPLEELGDVRYQLQQYDRAIDAYERSLRLDDRSPRVAYKLALSRYRSGNIEGAISALEQTVRLDDHIADAHYLLGVCLRTQKRVPNALKAFEKAVALSPALIPAREELADLYGQLGRRTDELDQLQLLAGLDRGHVERQVAVAMAYARARRWDASILTLTSALERTQDDPALYRAIGEVWLESAQIRGDRVELNKAHEALERAASTTGASSDVLLLFARALIQEGQFEAAEQALQQATQRLPASPVAFASHAAVAERLGHFDAARRSLIAEEALAPSDSEFVQHATRIATLSVRLNDAATAGEWIRRGLDKDPQNASLLALSSRVTAADHSPSDPSRPASRPQGN